MLGSLTRTCGWAHVEANDDCVGRGGQRYVGLGHATHGRVNDLDLDLGLVHFLKRVAQRFDGALNVGLDDQVELGRALFDAIEEVIEAHMALGLLLLQASTHRTLFSELASIALIFEYAELVARGRNARQAQDLDRIGRRGLLGMIAVRVDKRANTTVALASDNGIARLERTALHEHGSNRAATLVEVRFDNEAGSQSVGVSLKFKHISLKDDGLEQVVDAELLLRGNVHEHVGTAPLFGDDSMLNELLAHAVGLRARFVDFIHGNHDRHICSLSVVDGLNGLGHNAVVGSNHQNDDIGYLGAASTHGGKCLMARGVDEGNLATIDVNDRSTDMLRNAASLTRRDAGVANGVEQRRFAMVDVAHNGNHGRTRLEVFFLVVVHDGEFLFRRHDAHLAAHIVGDELDKLVAHGLGDGKGLAEQEQALDHVARGYAEQVGEFAHGGTLHDLDDIFIEHQAGIDATLHCLLGNALALSGLALFLTLLTTAFALVIRCGSNGGTRLGEHLVALHLLGLNGHLGVTIFAIVGKLRNVRLKMVASTLTSALGIFLIASSGVAIARRASCLLGGKTVLLSLNLRKQRVEGRFARRCGRCGLRATLDSGFGGGLFRTAVRQGLGNSLLLGDLGSEFRGARVLRGLLATMLGSSFLLFNLAGQARKARIHRRRRRTLGLLGGSGCSGSLALSCRIMLTTSAFFGAKLTLALDSGTTCTLLFGLLLVGGSLFSLGLSGCFGIHARSCLGAKLGGERLADFFYVGLGKDACVALRGDLEILNAREQHLAVHAEFLRQLMNSHAGHMVLLVSSPAMLFAVGMDAAETASRTCMVAARGTVFSDICAEFAFFNVLFLVEQEILFMYGCRSVETCRFNIDVPAGQACSEAGVLAFLANGKRQLIVGYDNGGVVFILVDDDAVHASGAQSLSDVLRGIFIPLNDVNALVAKLFDNHAHTRALGANARANRIEIGLAACDGDLRAGAGLAGDGFDFDHTVINFGHFEFEKTTNEVGVSTRNDDSGTGRFATSARLKRVGVAHIDDEHLNALVVAIVFAHRTLVALVGVALLVVMRKFGLNTIANLHDGEVGRRLKHGGSHDVAHAVAELLVDALTARFANHGGDNALCILSGDAAHAFGSNVALFELGVFAGLLVRLANRNELVDINLARGAVDGDASVPLKVKNVLIALGKRRLKTLDKIELVDLLLVRQGLQGLHKLGCHCLPSSSQ